MAKILIVEDEKAINDLVRFNLELVGHECVQTFDGGEGLRDEDRTLLELYEQALARFPQLLEQLSRHMAYGEPFGDDFKTNFDRG